MKDFHFKEENNKQLKIATIILGILIIIIIILLIAIMLFFRNDKSIIYTYVNDKIYKTYELKNGYMTEMPEAPNIENYIFDYWEYNGKKYDASIKLENGGTLKAVYKRENNDNVETDENKIKVILHINPTGKETEIEVTKGSTYSNLPTPTVEGHRFIGWYTAPTSGEEITNKTIVTNDKPHTLYARFVSETIKVTLHINPTGKETEIEVTKGSTYSNLPTPTVEGHRFIGWYTAPTSGEEITNKTMVTNDKPHTLYARFVSETIKVTLHINPTGKETEIEVTKGSTYSNLPTPTVEGHRFIGWYTAPTSGEEITNKTIVTNDKPHTLYARFVSE